MSARIEALIFSAVWCRVCDDYIGAALHALHAARSQRGTRVARCEVVDTDRNAHLVQQYALLGVPTVLFRVRCGEHLYELPGTRVTGRLLPCEPVRCSAVRALEYIDSCAPGNTT